MQERPGRRNTIDGITKMASLSLNQVVIYNDRKATKPFFIHPLSFCRENSKRIDFVFLQHRFYNRVTNHIPFLLTHLFSHSFRLTPHTWPNACGKGLARAQKCIISSHMYPYPCHVPIRIYTLTLENSHNTIAQSPQYLYLSKAGWSKAISTFILLRKTIECDVVTCRGQRQVILTR